MGVGAMGSREPVGDKIYICTVELNVQQFFESQSNNSTIHKYSQLRYVFTTTHPKYVHTEYIDTGGLLICTHWGTTNMHTLGDY